MVAKSYQNLELVSDIYYVNNKAYVNVKLKNGNIKQVRHYTENEYAKLYPEAKVTAADRSTDPYYRPQKDVLGFIDGYITIFKGDTYPALEWFKASPARYTRYWGWYFPSDVELPEDLPEGVEPVRLDWKLVGNEEGRLLPEDCIKPIVESLLYEEGTTDWVGNVGDRIEVDITVEKAIELEGAYGTSTMHIMRDALDNVLVWTTASKRWPAGVHKTIRGTVKDLNVFRGTKQTVLTRCREIQDKPC